MTYRGLASQRSNCRVVTPFQATRLLSPDPAALGSTARPARIRSTMRLPLANLTFTQDAGQLNLGGVISGSQDLTKGGPGTLVLGGVNSYSGTTTISAGTLQWVSPTPFLARPT